MIESHDSKISGSPPAITLRTPLIAPASPPLTGASIKLMSLDFNDSSRCFASLQEVVVWSMKIDPLLRKGNMPSSEKTISIISSSLPVHVITTSASDTASSIVWATLPWYSSPHLADFSSDRLKTHTLNRPEFDKCPAIG